MLPNPTGRPHKYWRLYICHHNGWNYNYTALWSMDFQDAAGNSLCVGGSAFTSSQYAYFSPDRLLPGGVGGAVSNNHNPWFVGYQFATPVLPDRIVFAPWFDGNLPVTILVGTSDDGVAWTFEWLIAQPAAGWVNKQHYTSVRPQSLATATHWLALFTQSQNHTPITESAVGEMRFLAAGNSEVPAFSNPRGSARSGGFSWAEAWDGNTATIINGMHTSGSTFCQVQYAQPNTVTGLKIVAPLEGFMLQYAPVAGAVMSSEDGMTFGYAWSFDSSTASGLPYGTGSSATFTKPIPRPPVRRRVFFP